MVHIIDLPNPGFIYLSLDIQGYGRVRIVADDITDSRRVVFNSLDIIDIVKTPIETALIVHTEKCSIILLELFHLLLEFVF